MRYTHRLAIILSDVQWFLSSSKKLMSSSFDTRLEFGSKRIPRSLLRGKRANAERHCSLRIEDSPQLAVESFNMPELPGWSKYL
jgi:hypothetical protein